MKKYIFPILILLGTFFSVIPSVFAWEQGTVTCIYKDSSTFSNGTDEWKKYLNVTFYGVGTTMPSLGEIEYYSIYNNDLNDKRSIFSYDMNSLDHFVNYQNSIVGIESQYGYASSIILSEYSNGSVAITENNQELVCPSKMFILEKTVENGKWNPFVPNTVDKDYDLYACGNNYGDYNNDTCPIIRDFLIEYRKTVNHDGTAGLLHSLNYYTGSLISNVGQKDPSKTNIQEQYNKTQETIEKTCEEGSENYNAEECEKAQISQGTNIQQAEENLGVNKVTLETGYKEYMNSVKINFEGGDNCDSYLGNPEYNPDLKVQAPAYYLQFVFNLLKYITIILLLVLTIVDFAKATASSKDEAIKKAGQATIKRVIIAVIIFFLPILIKFLFTIFGIYSSGTCGIS